MAAASFATAGDTLTAAQYNLLPRGVVAAASATANQTSISSEVDLSSLSVTWTATSSRSYRVTVRVIAQQLSSAGDAQVKLTNSSNTQVARSLITQPASAYATHVVVVVLSGLSGSVTYKARGTTSAGTVTLVAAGDSPASIVVEDIGAT